MQLYYIRHGDPIYAPDSLTEKGKKQAEALGAYFETLPFDEIYCSTSERAIQTARPTAIRQGKEPIQLDFCNERYMSDEFFLRSEEGHQIWPRSTPEGMAFFASPELAKWGMDWYLHPAFETCNFTAGLARVNRETDAFLENLGYQHDREKGVYFPIQANEKRIALFAHREFGMAFLSSLLDLPYPLVYTHFDICFTGWTVIDFPEENGVVIPKLVAHSCSPHLDLVGLSPEYTK